MSSLASYLLKQHEITALRENQGPVLCTSPPFPLATKKIDCRDKFEILEIGRYAWAWACRVIEFLLGHVPRKTKISRVILKLGCTGLRVIAMTDHGSRGAQ